MYLTSDATPGDILAGLITRPSHDIGNEFEKLRHNNDLCPAFRDRVESILGSYSRLRTSVDDIQCFSDQGVDVLLRYSEDGGGSQSVGLQIKSYLEIEQDLKKDKGSRTLLDSLHAQKNRAEAKHRVSMFYILLCGDGSKRHTDFIRYVASEFAGLDTVRVVIPRQCWSLYKLEDHEIAAYCTRILCAEDFVLRKAIEEMPDDSAHRRMLIPWVVQSLEGNARIDIDSLLDCIPETDDPTRPNPMDIAAEFIQTLEYSNDVTSEDGEHFVLHSTAHPALRALCSDVNVRYDLHGQDAIEYLWALTGDLEDEDL